jgi:hypothetical protein
MGPVDRSLRNPAFLDPSRRLANVFLVNPAEASFEQFKAGVPTIDKNQGNEAPVTIDRVRPEFHVSAEHKIAHRLLRTPTERLAFLRGVNKSDPDPDLLLGSGEHFDGIAITDPYTAAIPNRFLRQDSGSKDRSANSIPVR